MNINKRLITIAATALVLTLSGCGASAAGTRSPAAGTTTPMTPASTSAPAGQPGAAHAVLITIHNFMYSVPASVAPGAKVTVKNQDAQNHTVTSTNSGAFNVTVQANGGTATFTAPTKPGSYPFHCTFHADMMGTLVVA
jgi:plastocyanin